MARTQGVEIQAGDVISYVPREETKSMARQYDSPCACYGTLNGWAYLLRLTDGQYHVVRSWDECWEYADSDIPPHLGQVIANLMATWQEIYGG